MKQETDRVGQVLLLLIGGGLIVVGGSCAINIGASIFALLSFLPVGLGVWVIGLAMKKNANEEDNVQDSGKDNK